MKKIEVTNLDSPDVPVIVKVIHKGILASLWNILTAGKSQTLTGCPNINHIRKDGFKGLPTQL